MTASETIVVDYGAGNLFSICRAVEKCGGRSRLVTDPGEIVNADRAILPGVGAFGDNMAELKRMGMADALIEFAKGGRPLLGICLGMQMLFDASEEFGEHSGLGLIRGRVTRIACTQTDGTPQKVPHIGWNELVEPMPGRWQGTVLEKTPPGTTAYFVHSYCAQTVDENDVLATCLYGGRRLVAAIQKENVCGCQFHPERSGPRGLEIISRLIQA